MKIANNIYKQVTYWISSLFLNNSLSTFLPTNADCLSKSLRLALTCKFENYIKDGLNNIKSCSIYVVSSNPYLPDLKFAVHLTGLPQSSIRTIPVVEGTETIDMNELEKLIAADKTSNSVPLYLFADLGSSFVGGINGSLKDLSEISEKHELWLHISGPMIAALSLSNAQSDITMNISSMTLDFESWIGLPTVPIVLLYRQYPALKQGIFEIESEMRKLDAFPLWTVIQNLGRDKIVDSFAQAFQSCNILYDMVAKTKGFRLLSKKPVNYDPKEALAIDSFTSVVLFQFDGSGLNIPTEDMKEPALKKAIDKDNNVSYFDRLNSWLGQTLERDFPQIQLTLMDHSIYGTCIRYSPFELSTGEKVPTLDAFTEFYEFFENQADILCATVQKKQTFIDLIERSPVLKIVQLADDWAGLGGVYYVPEIMEKMETDQEKSELNKLNMQLVEKLRSSDNAFSLGESIDGLACIRFGMVTSETDIEELLDLVISAGNEIQESSKVLDSMAELIKAGIHAAQTDLQKEADEKVWNDGILRVVPVVGSVLNWINPLPRETSTGIRGRSLNLQQGVVESTENIYKYHMQLPLNPSQQGRSSTSHSRNESQSSTNSVKQAALAQQVAVQNTASPVEEAKPAA
ncbi:hypothetical protein ACKWTF_006299 [Chironomus riparius]